MRSGLKKEIYGLDKDRVEMQQVVPRGADNLTEAFNPRTWKSSDAFEDSTPHRKNGHKGTTVLILSS